ncbi:MAG TPA: hypothetical protein PKW71_13420, partial [Anaerohalosphaeraceae bacterium]|nr:hypothetical protein [Anaerohalosphaeraceae bacterium]
MNRTQYAGLLTVVWIVFAAAIPAQTLLVQYENQSSAARIEPAQMAGRPGIAVIFEGTDDLHYYASASTAPAPGLELTVWANADGIQFGPAVYPVWSFFNDPAAGKVEVYVGRFTVFVPLVQDILPSRMAEVTVHISGLACTSKL